MGSDEDLRKELYLVDKQVGVLKYQIAEVEKDVKELKKDIKECSDSIIKAAEAMIKAQSAITSQNNRLKEGNERFSVLDGAIRLLSKDSLDIVPEHIKLHHTPIEKELRLFRYGFIVFFVAFVSLVAITGKSEEVGGLIKLLVGLIT